MLLDRADPQATREYLQTILSESARLSRLVDNVLDFSRIEEVLVVLTPSPARESAEVKEQP